MNGLSGPGAARVHGPSLVGGSILAVTLLLSGAHTSTQHAAARSCAPVNASFGIFSDDQDEERINLTGSADDCQEPAGDAAEPVIANEPATEQTNIYAQMAAFASQQMAAGDGENAWLAAYLAQAHDRAE